MGERGGVVAVVVYIPELTFHITELLFTQQNAQWPSYLNLMHAEEKTSAPNRKFSEFVPNL